MRRLQVAVVGDSENPEAAEKTGTACARRGFIILTLADRIGEAVRAGAQRVNATVVVFDGGKKRNGEISITCHNATDALVRAIQSSDGVIVVGEGDGANLAYMLSLQANKAVAVVHTPEDSMGAVTKILEAAVSANL